MDTITKIELMNQALLTLVRAEEPCLCESIIDRVRDLLIKPKPTSIMSNPRVTIPDVELTSKTVIVQPVPVNTPMLMSDDPLEEFADDKPVQKVVQRMILQSTLPPLSFGNDEWMLAYMKQHPQQKYTADQCLEIYQLIPDRRPVGSKPTIQKLLNRLLSQDKIKHSRIQHRQYYYYDDQVVSPPVVEQPTADVSKVDGLGIPKTLTSYGSTRSVLLYLRDKHTQLRAIDLSQQCGIGIDTIRTVITTLLELGLIIMSGIINKEKYYCYIIPKQGVIPHEAK